MLAASVTQRGSGAAPQALSRCDYRLCEHENGIAVIQRLQSEFNEDIPALLITGDTAPDRLLEAQASGFFLLHKPVANSKLRAAIGNLIHCAHPCDSPPC